MSQWQEIIAALLQKGEQAAASGGKAILGYGTKLRRWGMICLVVAGFLFAALILGVALRQTWVI